MKTIYDAPPHTVQEDLDAPNKALDVQIPSKYSTNLLIATWLQQNYGSFSSEKYSKK